MLLWMAYVVLVTLLVGLAALLAEKAARLKRARCRWIWSAAMAASVLMPLLAGSVSLQVPASVHAAASGPAALRHLTGDSLVVTRRIRADAARAISSQDMDAWLRRLWMLASSALAMVLIGSAANLRWRQRSWVVRSVAGVAVYVAPDIGPAVVGVFRPRIVVPHWLTELPDAQQSLVIAHERAHLQAKDPQALAAALCLLVCIPWNAPLWWQLRRLRRASEVDCDAGIVRSGADARAYGQTLLAVGLRQSPSINTAIAMSQPRSFLEERIAIMLRKPSKSWALLAAACGGLSVALVAVATQISPPPGRSASPATATAPDTASTAAHARVVTVPAAVLDGYTGFYAYGDGAEVTTVSREGEHLLVEFPGLSAQPMQRHSATLFFGAGTTAAGARSLAAQGIRPAGP